jgi:hypothetical protein
LVWPFRSSQRAEMTTRDRFICSWRKMAGGLDATRV